MSTNTPVDCDCLNMGRDGTVPLMTTHMPDCPNYFPEIRSVLTDLVRGIESWAAEEDGVYPEVWDAYCRAKFMIGEPVKESHP